MSERTFRAVVASVLIGVLALAVVVAGTLLLPPSPAPSPNASVATSGPLRPTPTPPPTPRPTAFASVTVAGVGTIHRGGSSAATLSLSFNEASIASIGRGPGSFQVTLTDSAGAGGEVSFLGTPSTAKSPGSLGASATASGNVLTVSIVDSDIVNIEPIIVTGLGIAATTSAALGSIEGTMSAFTGSLAGGATSDVLVSLGTVVSNP